MSEARARTEALARQLAEANVVGGLRVDDPVALDTLDQLLGGQGREVLGVTFRAPDGEAVYARDPAAQGTNAPLDGPALQSLRSGAAETELEISADPSDTILRVHQPVLSASGDALLMQMDYDYQSITEDGRRAWQMFAPVTLGALVVMAAGWMCLAVLAARLRRKAPAYEIASEDLDEWLEPEPPSHAPYELPPTSRPRPVPAAVSTPLSAPAFASMTTQDDDGWLGIEQGGTPWPAVPFNQPMPEEELVLPGALRDGATQRWAARPENAPSIWNGANSATHGTTNGTTNGTNGAKRAMSNGGGQGARPTNGGHRGINGNGRRRSLETALSGMLLPLARRGIDTRLDLPPGLQLPDDTEELLIRAAEEAVRNSVSHADANTVKVRLDVRDQRVELTIDDDGRGFDPAQFSAGNGDRNFLGLRTLTRLAADAGGALHVRSSPNRGTRLHLDLPAI
ncbi:MAG: sensor histidine kinase [Egibacteraceae bacterium]